MIECMRHMGKFNSTLNNNKEKSKCKNNKDTDKSKKYLYEKFLYNYSIKPKIYVLL